MKDWHSKLKLWFIKAGIRAVKTVAQTFTAMTSVAVVFSDIDWFYVMSASVLAGIISLATSVAGLPELKEEAE